MLEAALRGELDDGLGEDLMQEASLSSQDSFSSAQPLEAVQRNEAGNEPSPEPSTSQQGGRSQSWEEISGRLTHPGSGNAIRQREGRADPSESKMEANEKILQRFPADASPQHDEASTASGESDLEIGRHEEYADGSDGINREGVEPSLHTLLHEHGDLFSDD